MRNFNSAKARLKAAGGSSVELHACIDSIGNANTEQGRIHK